MTWKNILVEWGSQYGTYKSPINNVKPAYKTFTNRVKAQAVLLHNMHENAVGKKNFVHSNFK